jgi:pyruvate/2-oxoglutarate dehydrogenase complex dihydrolipoamide acyltransferase (E2) component
METGFSYLKIPRSRIATFDTFSVGLEKHHVSALLEFDVTESRKKLQELRRSGTIISFNGWLIKVISSVISDHPEVAAFIYSKRKLIIFNDINISILVEKKIGDNRVPIPVVIEKTNIKSAIEITAEIENAKNQTISTTDMVLNKPPSFSERLYYHLPGFIRRSVWRTMLRNPKGLYPKMGNAVITSVGMMGKINGWFIHRSVHPISFGIGSILKKPVVTGDEIKIREILNMTILVDHDVVDGAQMVRFLNDLTRMIERGELMSGER